MKPTAPKDALRIRALAQAALFAALGSSVACGGSTNAGGAGTGGQRGGTGGAGTGGAGTGGNADAAAGTGGSGTGGSTASGAAGDAGSSGGSGGGTGTDGSSGDAGALADAGTDIAIPTAKFSFFVTSLKALQALSGSSQGFGGDLRFGETGAGAGLRGADKICAAIAERSLPGTGAKPWRAFLSAVAGEDGKQVNAVDRIGAGPWYDRLARTFALTKADLLFTRPRNANPAVANDFPNEDGVANHAPDATAGQVDNHDFLTGTNASGQLNGPRSTCADWTGKTGTEGPPHVGHSWPRGTTGGSANWMSALDEAGCAAGINLVEQGGPIKGQDTVGSGGGYGGFYCFSLTP
jgi:hypothetical protein